MMVSLEGGAFLSLSITMTCSYSSPFDLWMVKTLTPLKSDAAASVSNLSHSNKNASISP